MRAGRRTGPDPELSVIQADARSALERFDPAVRRRVNPHAYPAGLESALHARREALIESALNGERAGVAASQPAPGLVCPARISAADDDQVVYLAGLSAILAVRERAGHVARHGSNAGIDVGSQNLPDSP